MQDIQRLQLIRYYLKNEVIEGEYAVCANGAQYRKDVRGFLPELMEKIYEESNHIQKENVGGKATV